MLQGRKFSFSIIVHADPHGPLINFHQSSPILNVRSDCPPSHLLEFLVSEGGVQVGSVGLGDAVFPVFVLPQASEHS